MSEIHIQRITADNFHQHSLDHFVRHQVVEECWRNVEGAWKLLPIAFVEDWDAAKCRAEAEEILEQIGENLIAFAAFYEEEVVGYITISTKSIGTYQQYVQLVAFQVSAPHRGKHFGKKLFSAACEAARALGAEKLYISAHSSKESQAAYKALGCVHAEEIIPWIAEEEPCDVQLEYVL